MLLHDDGGCNWEQRYTQSHQSQRPLFLFVMTPVVEQQSETVLSALGPFILTVLSSLAGAVAALHVARRRLRLKQLTSHSMEEKTHGRPNSVILCKEVISVLLILLIL